MNKPSELFNQILVDGQEIDLQLLEANRGKINVGSQKRINVTFNLKDKTTIPAQLFNGVTGLKRITLPATITNVGSGAFANTGAIIENIEKVETIGNGALVGTNLNAEVIAQLEQSNPNALLEVYSAAEAAIYNLSLEGALKYGAIKVEGVEAVEGVEGVKYTQEEIDAATIVAGKTTEDWKVEPVEAVEGKDAVLYTTEEIEAHNAELDIWEEGKVKEPAVEAVEGHDDILYTDEEVEAHNAEIEGTVKNDDPAEEVYINDYPNVEYIVDQQSWEDSFNNGGIMAKYYETYPDNDLIAIDGSNKTATFNDRIYLGTITGEENEKRFKAGWSEKSQSLTNESDPSEVYYIKRLDEESPYYGTADEWKAQYIKFHGMSWQLYSDALLTTPVEGKEIYIRTLVFDGFTHTYAGMVANGGKLPWIGAWFTNEFNEEDGVHLIFKYEGKDDIKPWGDIVFGKGEGQKVWGFASISDEYKDNALAIQDCGGEGTFDQSKFSLVLEKAVYDKYTKETANTHNQDISGALQYGAIKEPAVEAVEGKDAVLYTTEEIEAHNAELDIWEEGKVKEPAVEAVEAVEGVKYTQEEIDAATVVAGKTTEDWKVEPVEEVEGVEEVLYTNEEVDAYNAELEGAVKAGDIKVKPQEEQPQEEQENQENQTANGEVTSENGTDTQIYNG